MTTVVQIDGAPGAGKTYTLKEKLQEHKVGGVGEDDFWWITFTRAGRDDVKPELRDVYPKAEEVEDRARTLHSLSLRLLFQEGLIEDSMDYSVPGPIIQAGNYDDEQVDPYAEFCDKKGMRYDPAAADPRRLLAGDEDTDYTGNKLFAINDYLTQTCKPPERWRDSPIDIEISGTRVKALLKEWETYKREAYPHRLFEHGDYVDFAYQAGVTPAVDLLLVDEFQDFAPLEYRLYKMWRDSGAIDDIYIAGDPNQAVYSFRGGTPYYFKNTDKDDSIDLKKSYRCPPEIASIGNAVLEAHPKTDPRGFTGRAAGGYAGWRSITNAYALRDGVIDSADRHHDAETPVMLLTRTNHQLRGLTNDLKKTGIPFEVLGSYSGIWREDLKQMLGFLNSWQSGVATAYSYSNVRLVLEYMPNGDERRSRLGSNLGDVIDHGATKEAFGDLTALDIVDRLEISAWKRDVLHNAVDAPAALNPTEVKCGTIHTAKGLESPAVYLFTTSTDHTVTQYSRNDDHAAEEHRVYYVGATRASEELHLVDGYFDGPIAPPVQKIRRRGGGVA